ncbi:MAG: endonuclease [Pseudomonadota bacterium]|nr:endonuclease [Pseudomonadota bacterium]
MKLARKRGYSKVSCPSCKATRIARNDYIKTKPGYCRQCASKIGGVSKKPGRLTGETATCKCCSSQFWRYKHLKNSRMFCSKGCADKHKSIYNKLEKSCLKCNKHFQYTPRPNSNSAGNYCSIKCRDNAYSVYKGGHIGARPRWKSQRNKFLKLGNNFCFKCGSTSKIHVHHVIPYRISKNDSLDNLVSLCPKCHSNLENVTFKIDKLSKEKQLLFSAIVHAKLQDTWLLFKGRHNGN